MSSSPGVFFDESLSPVSKLSFTCASPSTTMASAGIWSPRPSLTRSSITIWSKIELNLAAIANDARLLGGKERELVHHALRAQRLHDADACVEKDDGEEG